jgi:hypothetical protein
LDSAIHGSVQFWAAHPQSHFCHHRYRNRTNLITYFACDIDVAREGVGKGLPKTWSAMDGATEPYRDVFTGVFWESLSHTR